MFLEEAVPDRMKGLKVADGVTRFVANNPGKMTYHGTNTYMVEMSEGSVIIDPGPAEDAAHLQMILHNLPDNAAGILVTHHHSDHFGAAPVLREAINLPIYVSSVFPDDAFEADGLLNDGQRVGGLTALHTPGHASDHLCLARSDGVLFSGDHVMSWNSSIISPPDGDMRAYINELHRLIERCDKLYLPGHGPALYEPVPYVRHLLKNRVRREAEILDYIATTPDTASNIATALYRKSDPMIAKAAKRNVVAHLEKLSAENLVKNVNGVWHHVG